jgi:hypothetical protein
MRKLQRFHLSSDHDSLAVVALVQGVYPFEVLSTAGSLMARTTRKER